MFLCHNFWLNFFFDINCQSKHCIWSYGLYIIKWEKTLWFFFYTLAMCKFFQILRVICAPAVPVQEKNNTRFAQMYLFLKMKTHFCIHREIFWEWECGVIREIIAVLACILCLNWYDFMLIQSHILLKYFILESWVVHGYEFCLQGCYKT